MHIPERTRKLSWEDAATALGHVNISNLPAIRFDAAALTPYGEATSVADARGKGTRCKTARCKECKGGVVVFPAGGRAQHHAAVKQSGNPDIAGGVFLLCNPDNFVRTSLWSCPAAGGQWQVSTLPLVLLQSIRASRWEFAQRICWGLHEKRKRSVKTGKHSPAAAGKCAAGASFSCVDKSTQWEVSR